jgi:hypothetical protein
VTHVTFRAIGAWEIVNLVLWKWGQDLPHQVTVYDPAAVSKVVRKAHRPNSREESQKSIVLDNLDDVIAEVSGDGNYRFNSRQLFYKLRPIVMSEIGQELKIGNFTQIITDYEDDFGEKRLDHASTPQ